MDRFKDFARDILESRELRISTAWAVGILIPYLAVCLAAKLLGLTPSE